MRERDTVSAAQGGAARQDKGTEDVVAAAARDPGVSTLAPDAEGRWIPFQLTPGNQIRFAMTIDDRSVTAILDTGVSFTLLSQASPLAAKANIRPGGQASAIGGAVAIGWMPTRTLSLGGLTRKGGGVVVAPLPALATGMRPPSICWSGAICWRRTRSTSIMRTSGSACSPRAGCPLPGRPRR
ncbi:retropepsin-like aspartic protease [Sphingomonas sp. I4]